MLVPNGLKAAIRLVDTEGLGGARKGRSGGFRTMSASLVICRALRSRARGTGARCGGWRRGEEGGEEGESVMPQSRDVRLRARSIRDIFWCPCRASWASSRGFAVPARLPSAFPHRGLHRAGSLRGHAPARSQPQGPGAELAITGLTSTSLPPAPLNPPPLPLPTPPRALRRHSDGRMQRV